MHMDMDICIWTCTIAPQTNTQCRHQLHHQSAIEGRCDSKAPVASLKPKAPALFLALGLVRQGCPTNQYLQYCTVLCVTASAMLGCKEWPTRGLCVYLIQCAFSVGR